MSTQAVLDRLTQERQAAVDFIDTTMAAVESEERDLSETEIRSLQTQREEIEKLDASIDPLAQFLERRSAAADLSKITSSPARRPAGELQVAETRSLGQIFTESEAFANYTGRGSSAVVEVPEFRAVGPDPLLTTTVPGSVLASENQKLSVQPSLAGFPLLNLVGRLEVTSNSVSLVTIGDATGADEVDEGDAKPPVVWTASETSVTLTTIAGWFKFSRTALMDIPGLRGLIDQKIRRAIDKKLNELATTALLAGKTGGNTTTGGSGVDMVSVVREAIADLESSGNIPSAVMLNPQDAAAFDVAMLGKPLGVASINGGMWGLPIVPLPGMTAGTAIVGDVSEALMWLYRGGLSMYLTDSDISDGGGTPTSDFRHNILTSLGEVFGRFAVTDASALRFAVTTP